MLPSSFASLTYTLFIAFVINDFNASGHLPTVTSAKIGDKTFVYQSSTAKIVSSYAV